MHPILHSRLARYVAVSLVLIVFSLAFADADVGAILCVGVAGLSAVTLIVRAVIRRGRKRFSSLVMLFIYVSASILLLTHYSLIRDRVRWLIFSHHYKASVLALPSPEKSGLKHVEWDGWGFIGMDTTVFLAFDPTDSLAKALVMQPPLKAPGIPCPVVRIRRLESHWYAVLFYTDTYWDQDKCR